MPRNSDSYSLLILDEHLWKWIDACNYNDSLLATPDREECQVLLKRILAVWPVLLKLLNASQVSRRPPLWLPYVIRAADRLILAARDIPMKAIRSHVDELVGKIAEVESRTNELIEVQVEKERLVFISNYSSVSSEHHSATDYWPCWEPHVRADALRIVREKLAEFHQLLSERRQDLEKMHLEQITIRDRWAEMRTRLHPEQYEDTTAWWGSSIRPTNLRKPDDISAGIPEFLPLSEARISGIHPAHLVETSRGLSRIHLNTTASMGVLNTPSVSDSPANIPWSILRSSCLDLLKELSVIQDRKTRYSPVLLSSLNIVDILLRLLYCHDITQFDEDEQSLSRQIVAARQQADGFTKILSELNPSLDAVVARFTVDEKPECVQAAIDKLMEASRAKNEHKREDQVNTVVQLQANLNSLLAYKLSTFENPWEAVWISWNKVLGSSALTTPADSVKSSASPVDQTRWPDQPPPLQYSS